MSISHRIVFSLLLLILLLVGCQQITPTALSTTAVKMQAQSTAISRPLTATASITPAATSMPVPPTPSPVPTDVPDLAPVARSVLTSHGYTVTFEPSECPIEIPEAYTYECGTVIVPEDRSIPEGRQVRLPVVIFESTNPSPQPDPVIYLTGGGGANQLEAAQIKHYQAVIDGVLAQRDFIFYNQRGVTFTEPVLACPGYAELIRDLMGEPLSWSERYAAQEDFWLACQEDLLEQGIDLAMYNSAVNAADAKDLRIALGYEEANYYGTSYGTRLGLALIRDYSEGVRSIILDSVYPPQVDYYSEYAHNAVRAFDAVFDSCEADMDCRARYPDLEATFYEVVNTLNRTPETFSYDGGSVVVDGGAFMELVYLLLYSGETVPRIPAMIQSTYEGQFSSIRAMAPALSYVPDINLAVFYSIQSREETPFDSYEHAHSLAEGLPSVVKDFYVDAFARFHFDLCAGWKVVAAEAIEEQAVVADVPALVFAGQYDPITPPEWGRSTAAALTNSRFYEFPGLGHGVMRANSCGLQIGLQFIDDPTAKLDASCIDMLPAPEFQ